ncbi:hypothetical protein [Fulvivirga sediminis]|uniref:Uncharacterized protein n=1 Tax=Fulvivirga sediminis TaxID=2803949 RepID=A0A937FAN8_9BACT|nr:hypothetical protein [Fulvivirga sediminis]MBL3657390.1 hypothetical protein [Fulvivirga sediminis]
MRKLFIISIVPFLIQCSAASIDTEKEKPIMLYGNNVVVLSDLSNRVMKPKSVADTTIIFNVLNDLKPLIKRSMERNTSDCFKFYSVNQYSIDRIKNPSIDFKFDLDMSGFENREKDRSDYLFERTEGRTYRKDLDKVKLSIQAVYEYNQGSKLLPADLWYYLDKEFDNTVIDTTHLEKMDRAHIYVKKKLNKIILLTDGYIEAGRYGNDKTMVDKQNPNRTKFLSSSLIARFRREFNRSDYPSMEQFFEESGYGLIPLDNELLSEVELLVLEMDDRSIVNGVTTVSPTDREVIMLFWKKWLTESGVKPENLHMYSTFKDQKEMKQVVDDFLGI